MYSCPETRNLSLAGNLSIFGRLHTPSAATNPPPAQLAEHGSAPKLSFWASQSISLASPI